ncbi:MAG: type I-E CRISPR-associated protein Cas7/Cse4/CasC [Thermomicrobiales bacterium]
MILELHVLQNIAPANLNRDDTGSPKDAIFGGYRRARVSSQAWKRAIRNSFDQDCLLPKDQLAIRTKRAVDGIATRLVKQGNPEDTAIRVAVSLLEGLGLKTEPDKAGEELTQYLLYLGTAELNHLAELADQHWDLLAAAVEKTKGATGRSKKDAKADVPEEVKKATLAILDGGKAADLALFGRMLADLPGKNIDGAAQVAHAISTHAVEFEFDFYTAVDDLNTEEETGAGMMGTVEYNSATFYRYTNVDISQLSKNLNGDQELIDSTIRAYAEAFLTALPTGKQNSFAAQNPPSFAVAIVRDKGRWSLANAFVEPVATRKGDLVGTSIASLTDYWGRLSGMYGEGGIHATPVLVDPAYQAAATGFDAPSSGMTGWLDDISASLAQANGRS